MAEKEDVQNATVIIITTAWMLHCHCLFPTAVFCRKPSLIFVVVQLCKFFTAQNFNLSASCLVYKLVPTILINSSLYLLFHKLMDEKFYKSEKKKNRISSKRRDFNVTPQSQQNFPSKWKPPQHNLVARSISYFSSPSSKFYFILIDSLMKLKEIASLTLWF